MKKYYSKFKAGFTLVETLVALAIFSASIVALVSATSSGVANTNFAKNKITASYLAQEGMELVRNIRDTAIVSNTGWSSFVSAVLSCNQSQNPFGCDIDPLSQNLTQSVQTCGSNKGCLLHYRADGFYVLNDTISPPSPFSRQIVISNLSATETKVISTVFWKQGSVDRQVTVGENLFDWTGSSPVPPPPGPPPPPLAE